MSTLVINGRPFAAGLYWLERAGPAATARAARRFARPWCVHRAGQTGYAGGTEDDAPEGLPALAPALVDSIESEFWMALVAGDAAPGNSGGSGRFALTKVRDGAVLADGDEVFSNRDAAVEAFERARALGWDLYATPGLLAGGADREVTELDVSNLAAAPENVLRRAPFSGIRRGRLGLVLLLSAAIAGVWIAWLQRDALLDWIAGPEPVVVAAPPTDPDLAVAVDSVALIEACRRASIDYPRLVERHDVTLRLEQRDAHGDAERLGLLGAGDDAAIVVGQHDDGLAGERRLEHPLARGIEVVAIDQADRGHGPNARSAGGCCG